MTETFARSLSKLDDLEQSSQTLSPSPESPRLPLSLYKSLRSVTVYKYLPVFLPLK
jgi:hypothetical protein